MNGKKNASIPMPEVPPPANYDGEWHEVVPQIVWDYEKHQISVWTPE